MRKWDRYLIWRHRLLGETGQEAYYRLVEEFVRPSTIWLNAGCGHRLLDGRARESRVRSRVGAIFGCDLDYEALKSPPLGIPMTVADLKDLPYRAEVFDLVTMNYVAEHLADPLAVFREVARVLKPNGCLIIHTPNVWSYYALGARLLPEVAKLAAAQRFEGRPACDVYPTFYRANTPKQLSALLTAAGFEEVQIMHLPTEAITHTLWTPLWLAELAFIFMTPKGWRTNLCVMGKKCMPQQADAFPPFATRDERTAQVLTTIAR